MIPGHEIGGKVVAVGASVTSIAVGESAGVGCMVDSCRSCKNCLLGNEQYCLPGMVGTYNSRAKYPHCAEYNGEGGAVTYGGYSKRIVVDKNFVLRIPSNLDLAAATPLLCAGITVYSPMMHFGLRSNMKFGVIGLGGLGHMAVKFGVAWGCHTTVISRGTAKRVGALADLKADQYIDAKNAEEMKAAAGTFDFLLCTVSAQYEIADYLSLLAHDGQFVNVGAPPLPVSLPVTPLIFKRAAVAGSLIGGIKETQEMLDFCGKKNIVCDIEKVTAQQIEKSYERTIDGDVKYRFVIDVATI
jgi:alcohol dehydrogenase (NADP+)